MLVEKIKTSYLTDQWKKLLATNASKYDAVSNTRRKDSLLGDSAVIGRIILKWILNTGLRACELDLTGSG
jgi:hypothetical protein